jgi:hypothetical protein
MRKPGIRGWGVDDRNVDADSSVKRRLAALLKRRGRGRVGVRATPKKPRAGAKG